MTESASRYIKPLCHQKFEYLTSIVCCCMSMCYLILRRHMLKHQNVAYKIRLFNTEWANKCLGTFTRHKFSALCTYVI
jgi:hypothetical protein